MGEGLFHGIFSNTGCVMMWITAFKCSNPNYKKVPQLLGTPSWEVVMPSRLELFSFGVGAA